MNQIRVVAVFAAVGTSLVLGSAVASGAPTDTVPGTGCTVIQIERATQVIAPEAIAVMNETPGSRAEAEKVLLAQPADRDKMIEQLGQKNPEGVKYYKANKADIDAKVAKIVATCKSY